MYQTAREHAAKEEVVKRMEQRKAHEALVAAAQADRTRAIARLREIADTAHLFHDTATEMKALDQLLKLQAPLLADPQGSRV